MGDAPYDAIADWYDNYLRENPLYGDVVLPALLDLAGEVNGLTICDLACGQGFVSRALARKGAHVTGTDISANLLDLARRYEAAEPLGITYAMDDAQTGATQADASFDGVTCNLALMPIPDIAATYATVRRILRPGGWFAFSITHPCYQTPSARWVTREDGTAAREVAAYFDERYFTTDNSQGVRGQVGEFHRTLSTYLNTLIASGLTLDRIAEPNAAGTRAERVPGNREVPSILLVRALAE